MPISRQYSLAAEASIGGTPGRPDLVAVFSASRSEESNPAEGGGDGGAIGAVRGRSSISWSSRSCGIGYLGKRALPMLTGAHTWSPMAEISTSCPQLEHLIVGKKPASIVAIANPQIQRRDRRGHRKSQGQRAGVHATRTGLYAGIAQVGRQAVVRE